MSYVRRNVSITLELKFSPSDSDLNQFSPMSRKLNNVHFQNLEFDRKPMTVNRK